MGQIMVPNEAAVGLAPGVDVTRNRPAIEVVPDRAQAASAVTGIVFSLNEPLQRSGQVGVPLRSAGIQHLQRRLCHFLESHCPVSFEQRHAGIEHGGHRGRLGRAALDAARILEVFQSCHLRGGPNAAHRLDFVASSVVDQDGYLAPEAELVAVCHGLGQEDCRRGIDRITAPTQDFESRRG